MGGLVVSDDRRIAYSDEDTLMVMDLQTGAATRYFQVLRVWPLDLADGSMERVLTDPTAEEFALSLHGRRGVFHSRRAGWWGIYVLSRG